MDTTILQNLNALLVTNPTNIRYLTGFVGVSPEERESYVLLTQKFLYLFTSALYLELAKQLSNSQIIPASPAGGQLSNIPIRIIEISRENPLSKELANVLREGKIKRLGFEEVDLTVAEYRKLKQTLKNVTLVPTQNRIEEMRIIKREDEIANIRQAAKITDECFDWIIGKIKPGVTEAEIAWEIESFFRKQGTQNAFSPIVAFGMHTSQPHYSPAFYTRPGLARQGRALRKNNIVLLDFGARVNGYCSDMTRVVFVGKPNDEWINAYDTVLQAQSKATEYLASRPGLEAITAGTRPGLERKGGAADRIARKVIIKAGFPAYPHSLGHGVGLSIHEQPRLSYKNLSAMASTVSPSAMSSGSNCSAEPLKPGMVITIEPGIYIEGRYGIRIEDLILLKTNGIEILSHTPKKKFII